MSIKTKKWSEELRKSGYKALHPNDGWVDRDKKTITFMYPNFFDDAKVGDYIMLGYEWRKESHRSVKLIEDISSTSTVKKFIFEDDDRDKLISKRNDAIDSLIDDTSTKTFKFFRRLFK